MELGLILTGVVTAWFAVLGASAGWAAMQARAQDATDEELGTRVLGAVKLVTFLLGVPMVALVLFWLQGSARRDDVGAITFFSVVAGFFFLLLTFIAAIVLGMVGSALVRRMPAVVAAGVMFAVFVGLPLSSLLMNLAQYVAQRR